jgi:hypothetical protein
MRLNGGGRRREWRSEQKVSFDVIFAVQDDESVAVIGDWIVGSVYACLLVKQHK